MAPGPWGVQDSGKFTYSSTATGTSNWFSYGNSWQPTTESYSNYGGNYGPPAIQDALVIEPGKAAAARRKMSAWLRSLAPAATLERPPMLRKLVARDPLREHRARSFRRTPRLPGKSRPAFL